MKHGYMTDDCDLNKNTISGCFGGNGDIYITIQSRNIDGFCTGTHSVRISTSGGNFPSDVKIAAAELIRAMDNHLSAVRNGRYHVHEENVDAGNTYTGRMDKPEIHKELQRLIEKACEFFEPILCFETSEENANRILEDFRKKMATNLSIYKTYG